MPSRPRKRSKPNPQVDADLSGPSLDGAVEPKITSVVTSPSSDQAKSNDQLSSTRVTEDSKTVSITPILISVSDRSADRGHKNLVWNLAKDS